MKKNKKKNHIIICSLNQVPFMEELTNVLYPIRVYVNIGQVTGLFPTSDLIIMIVC